MQELKRMVWVEGETIQIVIGSPRHAVVIHCSERGPQQEEFENGEHPCFAYFQLINEKGDWMAYGVNFVPVLPDGRVLMVVVQRSVVSLFSHPTVIKLEHGTIELGNMESLEFPGGGVDPTDANPVAAILRELQEEAGIPEQSVVLYHKPSVILPDSADIATAQTQAVIHLQNPTFKSHVETDGGLAVYALTPAEVLHNIRTGGILSGQAVILPWAFYLDLKTMLPNDLEDLIEKGFIRKETIKIQK